MLFLHKILRKYWFLLIPVISIVMVVYQQFTRYNSSVNTSKAVIVKVFGDPVENRRKISVLEEKKALSSKESKLLSKLKNYVKTAETRISKIEKRQTINILKTGTMLSVLLILAFSALIGMKRGRHEGNSRIKVDNYAWSPIAKKTSWSPLAGGGSNFATNTLVELKPGVLLLKRSVLFKIFSLSFVIIGLTWGIGFVFLEAYYLKGLNSIDEVLTIFKTIDYKLPGMFTLIGFCIMFFIGKASRIDEMKNIFSIAGEKIPFEKIKALQVVSGLVSSKNGSFTCYELNIVLEDGNRKNVMNHGDQDRILHDGRKIADVVRVPFWVKGSST